MKSLPAVTKFRANPFAMARFAPIPGMVDAILSEMDPNGYRRTLNGLRAEYKPIAGEIYLLQAMADAMWRTGGCCALESRFLSKGMDTDPLLFKLARYESQLSNAYMRCLNIMRQRTQNRKYAEARMAASLGKRKPCTSVIQ